MRGSLRELACGDRPLTPLRFAKRPSPRTVQTGDKVDRCSETSWTLSTANQGGCRMPFHEVSRMDARLEFVMLASVEGANVRKLCRRFGDQPDDRLQMAGALAARRGGRASGVVAPTAEFAVAQRCSDGGSGAFGACGASGLGRPQDRQALKDLGHEASSGALDGDGDPEAAWGRIGRSWWRPNRLHRFERARPNELWQMDFKGHVAMDAGRLASADRARRSLALRSGACGLRQRADRDGQTAAHQRIPPLRPAREE